MAGTSALLLPTTSSFQVPAVWLLLCSLRTALEERLRRGSRRVQRFPATRSRRAWSIQMPRPFLVPECSPAPDLPMSAMAVVHLEARQGMHRRSTKRMWASCSYACITTLTDEINIYDESWLQ